jgi:hypothetical protein
MALMKPSSKVTITYLSLSTAGYGFVPWTKDNMDAVNRGWIMRGDTPEELAKKIQAHPENRKLMVPENLARTVSRYNEFSKKGKDEDFNRVPRTLGIIEKPPFTPRPLSGRS